MLTAAEGYSFSINLDENMTLRQAFDIKCKLYSIFNRYCSSDIHLYDDYRLSVSYGDDIFNPIVLTDDEVLSYIRKVKDETGLDCHVKYYNNGLTVKEW